MSLHSLDEVPEANRGFLVIEHGDQDLVCKSGSYQEIKDWLAGELVHNKWLKVMDNIENLILPGSFTIFNLPYQLKLKTTVVVRLIKKGG